MLLAVPVAESKRIATGGEAKGLDKLKLPRSVVPAVTHVDGSARVQTVDPKRHGRFYRLLKAFEAQTGCAVLVQTSLNVRGEPIAGTPDEAYRCFLATGMDALVMEDCLLVKEEQPPTGQPEAGKRPGNSERN